MKAILAPHIAIFARLGAAKLSWRDCTTLGGSVSLVTFAQLLGGSTQ
jgi:hypothetical protein